MPSTSSCQKVRFVELRPVPAFQIARAHHIGSVAYADGALSAHNTRSISMLRGQGSEARYHGTQVRAQVGRESAISLVTVHQHAACGIMSRRCKHTVKAS